MCPWLVKCLRLLICHDYMYIVSQCLAPSCPQTFLFERELRMSACAQSLGKRSVDKWPDFGKIARLWSGTLSTDNITQS